MLAAPGDVMSNVKRQACHYSSSGAALSFPINTSKWVSRRLSVSIENEPKTEPKCIGKVCGLLGKGSKRSVAPEVSETERKRVVCAVFFIATKVHVFRCICVMGGGLMYAAASVACRTAGTGGGCIVVCPGGEMVINFLFLLFPDCQF